VAIAHVIEFVDHRGDPFVDQQFRSQAQREIAPQVVQVDQHTASHGYRMRIVATTRREQGTVDRKVRGYRQYGAVVTTTPWMADTIRLRRSEYCRVADVSHMQSATNVLGKSTTSDQYQAITRSVLLGMGTKVASAASEIVQRREASTPSRREGLADHRPDLKRRAGSIDGRIARRTILIARGAGHTEVAGVCFH